MAAALAPLEVTPSLPSGNDEPVVDERTTPMLPTFFRGAPADQVEKLKNDFLKSNFPLGRVCRPEEIATVALFLDCDDSSYVTGIALPVDGGYTAR